MSARLCLLAGLCAGWTFTDPTLQKQHCLVHIVRVLGIHGCEAGVVD